MGELREAHEVAHGHRLLEKRHAEARELLGGGKRIGGGIALVRIDIDADAGPDGVAHRADHIDVAAKIEADFHLQPLMTALDGRLRLIDRARFAGDRDRHRQPDTAVGPAAEHLVERHTRRLAGDVAERHVERGLGGGVGDDAIPFRPDPLRIERVHAKDRRHKQRPERGDDRFDRLAIDGGTRHRFAKADEPSSVFTSIRRCRASVSWRPAVTTVPASGL